MWSLLHFLIIYLFIYFYSDCIRWTLNRTGTSVLMTHARVHLSVTVHVSVTPLPHTLTNVLRRGCWWTGGPTICAVSFTTVKVIYPPTSRYKPSRLSFFCRTQTKTLGRMFTILYTMKVNGNRSSRSPKMTKNIMKVTKVVQMNNINCLE